MVSHSFLNDHFSAVVATSRFTPFLRRLTAFSDVACLRRFWCVVFFVSLFLEEEKLTCQTHPIRKLTWKDSIEVLTNFPNKPTRLTQFTEKQTKQRRQRRPRGEAAESLSRERREAIEDSGGPPQSGAQGTIGSGGFRACCPSGSGRPAGSWLGGGSAGGRRQLGSGVSAQACPD